MNEFLILLDEDHIFYFDNKDKLINKLEELTSKRELTTQQAVEYYYEKHQKIYDEIVNKEGFGPIIMLAKHTTENFFKPYFEKHSK